jgi:hypothetical protein
MSKFGQMQSYLGVSNRLTCNLSMRHDFFKRFDSKEDVFLRALCVVTAPVLYIGVFSPLLVILTCVEGLKTLIALLTLNFNDAKTHAKEAASMVSTLCTLSVKGVLSPVVNGLDFVGSIVATAIPEEKVPATAMKM